MNGQIRYVHNLNVNSTKVKNMYGLWGIQGKIGTRANGSARRQNSGISGIVVNSKADFGDAPISYGTFFNPSSNGSSLDGATHGIIEGLRIGEFVTTDPDGKPSPEANKDEDDGLNPETDVLIKYNAATSTTNTFTVPVKVRNNSVSSASLIGWIDFNLDGQFSTNEASQIKEVVQRPGNQTVMLTWEDGESLNENSKKNRYMRLRFATEGQLSRSKSTGTVLSGEVEDYLLNDSNVLLPVELIGFEAEISGKDVELQWSTASELTNDKFIIEHSFDGLNYSSLAELEGQGTTEEKTHYSFTHGEVGTELTKVFYRLKQIDYDGSFEYSDVCVVVFDKKADLSIYPVPAKKGQQIVLSGINNIPSYLIYNSQGKIGRVGEATDRKRTSMNTSKLESGMYIISFEDGRQLKFVIE